MTTRMRKIRITALLVAAIMLLAAFTSCAPAQPSANDPSTDAPDTNAPGTESPDTGDTGLPDVIGPSEADDNWAENMNANTVSTVKNTMRLDSFDSKFLSFISERTDGNYMVSPLSFRYALGLLLAGAEGETRNELLKAFGVRTPEEWTRYCLDFNGFVNYFAENLDLEVKEFRDQVKAGWISPDSDEPFRALRVANSVWKADWIEADLKADYCESVSADYAAEYRYFSPSNAVAKINEWADTKTEHMIQKLLPEGYPTDSLAVVLMNALYFKDAWYHSFEPGLTREMDFHAKDGSNVKKEFMTDTDYFSYYEDGDTQLVILPMKGGVYMAFVIGSTEDLSEKISSASYTRVRVTIPKMDLETDFSDGQLVRFLADNGVSLSFEPDRADFSGMIDYPVYVSDIIQKTRIKLDEEGVEAAAVTAIMVNATGYMEPEEPREFTADRPFSFYIYTTCNDTTAVMFAGEIVE